MVCLRNALVTVFLSCFVAGLLLTAATHSEANNEIPEVEEGADPGQDPDAEAKKKKTNDGYRILPIPIFITEPAIGNGLGVAVALFHPAKTGAAEAPPIATPASIEEMDDANEAPPVITGAFGAYTENGSWMGGLGHFNNWRNDSIRYTGAVAAADIRSEFYVLNIPLAFKMESVMVYQDVKFRVGGSNVFLGAALSYLDSSNSFDLNESYDLGDLLARDIKNIGLAFRAAHDSRDNLMSPTSGNLIEASVWRYDEAIGGNFNYWLGKLKALQYFSLKPNLILGLRLETSVVDGEPPFFAYPYVKLRGIPALRYQNKQAGAVETELRYRVKPRWEVSVFAGWGFISDKITFFENPDSIYNFGAGFRYNVFKAQKVWFGVDMARGPEDWNWYVQVGQPW